MKNLNQEGLNELSQPEVTQIEGGSLLDSVKSLVNVVVDDVNGVLSGSGYQVSHWK